MSVSIDGKIHKGYINVKYGDPFPKAKRSMELHNSNYGYVLVYIIELGQPEWTEKFSVKIPFRYYITDILKPNKKYIKQKKLNKRNLKLIK